MVRKETLKEQFSYLGVSNVPEEVLGKCEEICNLNGIDEEELVEVWMAFSVSQLRGADPTLDTLVQMERKEFGKKQDHQPQPQQQSSRSQENTLVIYVGKESGDAELEDNILDSYSSTPKAKNKCGRYDDHTPDTRPARGRSPRATFSPASFSPTVATPSSKYRARTNKGDAVCTYGEKCRTTDWYPENTEFQLVIQLPYSHMPSSTYYMFNQLRDMARVLDEIVYHLGQEIVSKFSLEEPQAVNLPHQSQFVGVGRVCCDSNGRLNAKSIVLESFAGKSVPMDLSQVENFSLFPGQIIVVEGENPLGSKLCAKQIYSDASLPFPPKPSLSTEENGPMQIVVAAGPFTQSDTLTYQPLQDFVEYILEHKPHLVILIGPFIDATHPHVVEGMLAETFLAFFEKIVDGIMEPLKKLNTKVLMVPSCRDAHHHAVYPVPPYVLRKQYAKLTLAPDPCVVDIHGLTIGVTSTDVLLHLGKEEISQLRLGSDRLGRIAGHILSQQCFYPLYPPAEEINLDLELWAKYASLEVMPHILILPSDLRCFIKNLNGCITVNPEHLAKGLVGGNFARLEVSCVKGDVNVSAQVVKI
ncbi:DNA polymerase alpha subunit B isoform X2 [Zootermopsis nevadensis]|uniref:DNA polymerase alpha subunit B n=1 Tax=Zootermopsis nevadensis TaxID=136037 RepID=A0A067RAB1_ZOONE|nr:DNA polymerase alpha subunit B isoform X2 [Zootermopsis nevadensis]KDR20724.1 DNA polymerase alpha subunit B [Zootermopsis nevadensis]